MEGDAPYVESDDAKYEAVYAARREELRTKRSMDRRQEDGGVKRQRIEEVAAPAASSSSDEVENLKRQLAAAKAALAKSKPTEKVFQISKKEEGDCDQEERGADRHQGVVRKGWRDVRGEKEYVYRQTSLRSSVSLFPLSPRQSTI